LFIGYILSVTLFKLLIVWGKHSFTSISFSFHTI